jgi:hypothetical protein
MKFRLLLIELLKGIEDSQLKEHYTPLLTLFHNLTWIAVQRLTDSGYLPKVLNCNPKLLDLEV